jgi:hypothetical protein
MSDEPLMGVIKTLTKGQDISKANFLVLISSKQKHDFSDFCPSL